MTAPPSIDARLALAKARSAAARARLSSTIGELQERTRPAALVHDATDTLKQRGTDMALGLVDTATRQPARTGATVALVALFLGRHQIARLFRRDGSGPNRSGPKGSKSR